MKPPPPGRKGTASEPITAQIAAVGGWRGRTLTELRRLIHEAVPDVTEEWKRGTPVWTRRGMVCSAGAFKHQVQINFFRVPP